MKHPCTINSAGSEQRSCTTDTGLPSHEGCKDRHGSWTFRAGKALLLGSALLLTLPEPVLADPPPWAPAHGWRRKQGEQYVGYTGSRWDRDYGIIGGRCDSQAIGAAAGAVVGGVIGSRVGEGEYRGVATVIGAVIGSVIGARVAASMDESDRACIGHSLELAGNNTPVNWVNPATRVTYVLTPVGGYKQDGRVCREFTLRASNGRDKDSGRAFACQMRDGTWQLAQKEGSRKDRGGREQRDDRDDHPGKGKGHKNG
jgi:surface antigen